MAPGAEDSANGGPLKVALPARPARVPALDPLVLAAEAQEQLAQRLQAGESPNTQRSYRTGLRYWAAWYWLRYAQPLRFPVPLAAVLQFVLDHSEAPAGAAPSLPPELDAQLVASGFKARQGVPAHTTLEHRLAVLSKAHQLLAAQRQPGHPLAATGFVSKEALQAQRGGEESTEGGTEEGLEKEVFFQAAPGLHNPVADPAVRELLKKLRQARARQGQRTKRQPALTAEPLQAMLATCDDSLAGVRDRALLLFAWSSGGRRRSEVAAATCEQLRRLPSGDYVFELGHSKTNQSGAVRSEDFKPVQGEAADALFAWLQKSGIAQGAVFRRVRRGGVLGEPLSPAGVRDIVQARAAKAGLSETFSAHSLRVGFVTEAGRQGMPLPQAMALTGHRSTKAFLGYFEAQHSSGLTLPAGLFASGAGSGCATGSATDSAEGAAGSYASPQAT